MRNKPDHCFTSGCPLAEVGRGFVLGTGDPEKAKMAIILEAPGKDELEISIAPVVGRGFLETTQQCDAELQRRVKAYPDIPLKFIKKGAPVVGRSGAVLNQWVLPAASVKREDLFIDNTLRCLPPKIKDKQYPTGEIKTQAEACCRHYDRIAQFNPTALVMTIHPAGLMREVTPLPLMIKDVEKAKSFVQQGYKTILFMGGKAAKAFMRYGENITKWRGSYELVDGVKWYFRLRDYLQDKANKKIVSEKKKATKKAQLEAGLAGVTDVLSFMDAGAVSKRKPRKKKEKVIEEIPNNVRSDVS